MMVGFPSESHGDESAFLVRSALLSVNELTKFSAPRFNQKFLVQINTEKTVLFFQQKKKILITGRASRASTLCLFTQSVFWKSGGTFKKRRRQPDDFGNNKKRACLFVAF